MIQLDLRSNIEAAMIDADLVMRRQIPYALALSINETLEQARERIVKSTYPASFNVRNQRLANANFTVDRVLISQRRGALDLGIPRSLRQFRSGETDAMVGRLRQRRLKGGIREWFVPQAEGGTRPNHRGGMIAIPQKGDQGQRSSTGRIKAQEKPRRIVNRKGNFLVRDKSGKKKFIARRIDRNTIDFLYFFAQEAKIPKRFRFYEDAHDTASRLFMPTFHRVFDTIKLQSNLYR